MTARRISSASFARLALPLALAAIGCTIPRAPAMIPPPGGSIPLSIDGVLRSRDLDALAPQCVDFVRDVGHVDSSRALLLLVPGGDVLSASESLTLASGLREAGYVVRRSHRRRLEAGETLVEVFPVVDGAVQLDDGESRAWIIEVELRLFENSEAPAVVTKRLVAEAHAALPQPP